MATRETALHINALYEQARDGEKADEDRLFQALSVSLRLFVRHRVRDEQDGYEIVQESLLIIARKYREMEFESSFSAWAYKVLEHVLMRFYRSQKTRDKVFSRTAEGEFPQPSWEPDPTLKPRLLDCLKKLSDTKLRHARILSMHFQGYSSAEICQRLEISTNNFYVILSRARKLLESCLEKGDIK